MGVRTPPPLSPLPDISSRPARVRWSLSELLTQDGHRLRLGFTASVATLDQTVERKLLAEVFGDPSRLTLAKVQAHFQPALQSTAATVAGSDTAERLLNPDHQSRWTDALRATANEVAFNCGLEVLAPYELDLTSPTLDRERAEAMQRLAIERRNAERVGQFAKAAELLKQWESLKTAVPSVTPGQLLQQVNPADRGQMLDTLLMTAAGQTTPNLYCVSGQSLVRIEIGNDTPLPLAQALPATVGPLRSISFADGQLLIGARSGVLIADPTDPAVATIYQHPELISEHGFTSPVRLGDRLWACHRIGGLVGWLATQPAQPDQVFAPGSCGGEPRYLTPAGLFAAGCSLRQITPEPKIEPVMDLPTPIVGILHTAGQVIIATEDGLLTMLSERSLEKIGELPTTGRLTGIAPLPWLSSTRLLLLRPDGPIDCIGLDDQLHTQFTAGAVSLRAVTACASKLAAMTSDRQRIILWNPWDGRRPAGELHIPWLTHHRIADLAFAG